MIERKLLYLDEPPESEKRRKPHARINNNLLNRPLARDRRVQADWKFSEKHQRWSCYLPGTKQIRFRLPSGAERRLPDAFDVAVLFLLLRQARMSKSRKLEFASRTAMLRELGVEVRVRHRRRLQQALILWSQLSIRWEQWYREAQYESSGEGGFSEYGFFIPPPSVKTKDAERVKLVLPPPIESLSLSPLVIMVAEAWLKYSKFETKIDWPLPMRAAVQNLTLALLANPTARRSLRAWCRTAGLNNKSRNRRLPKVVLEVSQWFEEHKGKVVQMLERDGICWFIRLEMKGGSTTQDLRGHNAGPEGPQRRTR